MAGKTNNDEMWLDIIERNRAEGKEHRGEFVGLTREVVGAINTLDHIRSDYKSSPWNLIAKSLPYIPWLAVIAISGLLGILAFTDNDLVISKEAGIKFVHSCSAR